MRVLFILLVIVLLMLETVSAVNESDIREFTPQSGVKPPSLPGEETGKIQVSFALKKDYGEVSNAHVLIFLVGDNTGESARKLQFTQEGKVDIKLTPGRWVGTIGVDEASTLGSDYFANIDISVYESATIVPSLVNVGNVRGEVYDAKNRVVRDAKVRVNCKQYISPETETDEFGTFLAEYIAPGECSLAAVHSNSIGYASTTVNPGSVSEVKILLDKEIASQGMRGIAIGTVAVGVLLLSLFIGLLNRTKLLPKEGGRHDKAKKDAVAVASHRLSDIAKTLNAREKAVVDFLLKSNLESTQAKILYGTNIPKTSLMRVLEGLAARNIAEVQKVGKAKKVRLTDWALGREEKK